MGAEVDCFLDVKALAIGGGGMSSSIGGGGGSGYPEIGDLQLQPNETLNLIVKKHEKSSIEKDGQVILTAAAGHHNHGSNGGDGYSGAGAKGQDGGSDGSDGEDSSTDMGGKGSGLDVGTLNMTRFTLSPGKAGSNGGGGGGILVNGEGPSGEQNSQWGKGFGGGGGYSNGNHGVPGCVIIEVL